MTDIDLPADTHVLVTGVTGYIGGRLVPVLLEQGYRVRVLARDPSRLQGRPWLGDVDVVKGDVLERDTLYDALEGVDVAYYLIHSMSGSKDFLERDIQAADNFGSVAAESSVKRIVYLGGLGDPEKDLSKHLRSRQQTGETLRESGVPVTEFRAGVIVGSGSLSFEMIRYLTERVPIMICPRWVFTRVQPIGIRDTLNYLTGVLDVPESAGQIIEIGGADVLTYGDMMMKYAEARDLRRFMIPVPVLTPRLSSYWVHWVTPVPADIARPLIEGLKNEVIVRDDIAQKLFPDIQPMTYETAVHRALDKLDASEVETRWTDSLASSQRDEAPTVLTTQEGMMLEVRQRTVDATPHQVFRSFTSLGGEVGWLYFNWAWHIRGIMDRMVGGSGLRRGRRHPEDVRVGDALDFWRVEAVEVDKLLRLRAEMKVPGLAWLEFKIDKNDADKTRLTQIAYFAPKGLFGLLYWYALYPMHGLIFSGMIRKIGERARAL